MENKFVINDFAFYQNEADEISDITSRCRYLRKIILLIKIEKVDIEDEHEILNVDKLLQKLEIIHANVEKERKEEEDEKLAKSDLQKGDTKDNFIVWAGNKETLFTLIELLVESKLLREVEYNEIDNVISSHFIYKGERNKNKTMGNKLKWGKSLSLLAYLICRLEKLKYLTAKNLHYTFSKHFFDKHNEYISNTDLSKALSQIKDLKRNKNTVPKVHYVVDDILNVVIGKKLKENFLYFSRG